MELSQSNLLKSLTVEEQTAVSAVEPRISLGESSVRLPPYIDHVTERHPEPTPQLFEHFQKSARRLPTLPAVIVRALIVGAVLSPIAAALGSGAVSAFLATLGSGIAFGVVWRWRWIQVDQMRHELLDRLEDRLGKLVYEKLQDRLGVAGKDAKSTALGVIPTMWLYMEDWEAPLGRGFDGLLSTGAEVLHRMDGWPDGFLPEVDWMAERDAELLHHAQRFTADEAGRVGRQLLTEKNLFGTWRSPSFPTIESTTCKAGRLARLETFEQMPMGEFFEALSRLHEPHESEKAHARRVIERMDLMALRCMPMAPAVPEHEWDSERQLDLQIPASLKWSEQERIDAGSGSGPIDGVPESSKMARRAGWLFKGASPTIDSTEVDHTSALAIFPAPSAAGAMAWLGKPNTSSAYTPGSRRALLLGMSKYKKEPLAAPEEDARVVEESLQSLGFAVTTLHDLSLEKMKAQIKDFAGSLTQDSIGFFMFMGHGCEIDGANFLASVGGGSYNLDELFRQLSNGSTNIIVVDTCRSVAGNGTASALTRIPAPPNTIIAYATTESVTAWDGVYAPELARELLEPNLRIEDVFIRTRRAVIKKTGGKQVPWEESSLEAPVLLNSTQGGMS